MPGPPFVMRLSLEGGPVPTQGSEPNDVPLYNPNTGMFILGPSVSLPMKVVEVAGATLTLGEEHRNAYIRCLGACVVTVNAGVLPVGCFVIFRAAGAGVVSFAGTVVITPPVTKLNTTAQQGATIAIIATGAQAADSMGDLSDA